MEAHASFGGLDLWVWLVAGLILVCLLILANQKPTDVNEKPQNMKTNGSQLGDMDDRYVEFFARGRELEL
jgi:hypothetical protein